MKISFFLRKPKDKTSTLNVRINIGGDKRMLSSGIKLSTKDWNTNSQWLRKRGGNDQVYIGRINTLKKILDAADTIHAKYPSISASEFKVELEIMIGRKQAPSEIKKLPMMEYLDHYNKNAHNTLTKKKTIPSPNYIKGFVSVKNHLDAFEEYRKKNHPLSYEEINASFAEEFEHYLTFEKNLAPNTIFKYMKLLKTILNKAVKLKHTDNKDFRDITLEEFPTHHIALTNKELKEWSRLMVGKQKPKKQGRSQLDYATVRDTFILSCLLALRYSEFEYVNADCVISDNKAFRIWQPKNKRFKTIPLDPKALALLKKMNFTLYNGTAQKYNAHLKTLAQNVDGLKEMEVWEKTKGGTKTATKIERHKLISSHTGRRTGATHKYRETGSIEKVARLLNDTTKIAWGYVVITDEELAVIDHDADFGKQQIA